MNRHLNLLPILAVALLRSQFAACAEDWPGVWVEAEAGHGDAARKSVQYASGAWVTDWHEKGGLITLDIDVPKPMPHAVLYLRYARDDAKTPAGQLDAYLGPQAAKKPTDSGVRHLGEFSLPYVGPLSSFRWVRLSAGDLPAGKQRLILSCPPHKSAGYLDMAGIVPGDLRGLWTPPNKVVIGEFKDKPGQAQPVELLDIQCPTIGDWLPEAEYLGKNAKPVDLSLEIRNNLCPDAASITLKGTVTMEGARPVDLPVQKAGVAADTTCAVHYTFAVPQKGRGVLKLTMESEGQSLEREIPLATSAFTPVWTELKKDGKPVALAGPDARYAFDVSVPNDLPGALLYVRYDRSSRAAEDGAMDIYLGPKGVADTTDAQVRKLGRVTLARSDRQTERTEKSWACVNAGHLNQGDYRVFFVLNEKTRVAEPGQRLRYDQNNFHAAGLVPDAERGLWVPSPRGEGLELRGVPSMREPVVAERLVSPVVGSLFPENQYVGAKAKEMPFALTLRNNVVTAPLDCVVRGELADDRGVAAKVETKTVRLDPGASLELPYPVKAPGCGWFDLRTTIESDGRSTNIRAGLGVIHPAAKGVRPDSMFGLSVGDKPEDMQVAELIGVKWRRGIPHTNPADVLKKTGDPFVRKPEDTLTYWNEQEISAVRDVIHQWKDHGVLCLGFVNYNLPWNCLGGGAGGWHRNRPDDMKIHTDMVYHLIQPLHDEVKYWEIWNEPWVGGWTWRTGTAQDYRDMSRMIWDRVKPEMPDVKLIGGGSTAYQRDVLFATNSENAGYVDGVSTHPYGKPDMNHPSFAAIESALLKKYSKGSDAGIWATELGTAAYMFAPLPRFEEDLMVARTVAPLYLLGKLGAGETPIRPFFFTSLYGSSNFSGGEHNLWDDSAGVPAPRPALVAYSAMTHFLEDSKLLGDIYAASKSAWALHFVKPDGTSIVVLIPERRLSGEFTPATFDASERQQSVVRLPGADFTAYDFLGRPIGQREGDRLRMPMQTWEARYLVSKLPPEKVREAINSVEFEGLPSLLVNPRSFDAPLSTHPKLRIKVENLLPRATDAHLEVTAPKEIQLETTTADLKAMKPGEIRFAEFAVLSAKPNEINRYKVQYRAQAGGVAQEGDQVVQVACSTYGTPQVDGDLADWKDAIPVTMVARGGKDWREIALNPDKAADLLAQKESDETVIYRLWTKWDAQNFYVAAQVPDATFERAEPYHGDVSTTKNMPYMGDCLQIAFHCLDQNPDDLLRGNPLYEKALGADVDYEFCAAQLANGHSELHRLKAPGTKYQGYYPTNHQTTPSSGAMQAGPNGGPEGKVVARYDKAAKAWFYELAIPWTCIHGLGEKLQTLRPGQTFRTSFAFAVNDAGGRNRTFWTQEAGDLQAGSYGFSPSWGGGGRQFGGRILTDWGFTR
jgi:hypothetical protein